MRTKFKEAEIGLIPEDWDFISLDNICKINMGQSPSSKYYNIDGNGLPFFQGRKDFGDKYPKVTMWCSEPNKIARKGDVLVSVRAPVGDINVSTEQCCIGRGLSSVFMKNGNNEFLFYLFQYSKQRLKDIFESEGTVFGCITKKGLNDFKVPLPPIKEQIKIESILSGLDDKIELNNQMNQTLEAIGQAIFRHWFVHFEFPDGEGRPYKSSGGEMVDSELGVIPVGWEVKVLPEVTKIIDCLHTKKPDPVESDYILLQVYNIAEDGTLKFDKIYTVSEHDYDEWTKNILLRGGDCVVTNAGRVGAVGQVPSGFEGGIGRNITAIRPEKITPTYLLRYLFSKHGQNQILILTDQGTILNSLNVKGIKKIRILIPPEEVLKVFDNIARPLREKVEKNTSENINLAKVRDSLLPKLMSGKIRL